MCADASWGSHVPEGRRAVRTVPRVRRDPGAAPDPRAIFDRYQDGYVEHWLRRDMFPPGACAESMACSLAAERGPQLVLYDGEGHLWSICRPLWNGGLEFFLGRIREAAAPGPDGRPTFTVLLVTAGHWGAEGGVLVEMLLVQDVCRILGTSAELSFRSVLMDGGQYVWRELSEEDIAAILAEPRLALWQRLEAVRTDERDAPPPDRPGEEPSGDDKKSDHDPS